MDDQGTNRKGGGSVIRYGFKDAARDVLRATVIVAIAMTVFGLMGTYFDNPSGKMRSLAPLSERLTTALYMGPISGGAIGAAAGIVLASFRFIKSLFLTT
jgi:hypothetical protein